MPAGGTCVQPIVMTTQIKPYCLGKPNPFIVDVLEKQHNIDRKKCLMIGDNLDTDIKLGENAGIDTLLVLTGNTSK